MIKIFLLAFLCTIAFSFTDYSAISCKICHQIVKTVQNKTPKKPLLSLLENIALQVCIHEVKQDKKVCVGAIKEMAQYILAGLWRHATNPHLVCQNIKLCSKEYVKRDLKRDIERITKGKPEKEWEKITGRKTLKIMHISDLHPDLFYSEGSPVKCTEPVCCRANVTAQTDSPRAGYWGSIGDCDLPLQTFDVFIKEAIDHKPDAIIWTGDNTPHDIWQQSQSYNLNFTTILSQKLAKIKTIVIPAMGNHESWPVNVYDHHSEREDGLNAGLAQAWSHWLDERAIKMQREKGYYSMTYAQLNNLKVLSVNTQAANDENWLLLQDPSDPGDILAWIEEELIESEKSGQIVYIIGHIPINGNLNEWSMRFNALVDRYSYIIRGQFYGHTHEDEISFFPSMKKTSSILNADLVGFNLVAPSLTTYSDRMPEYRVMEIDYDTLELINYKQFRLDIRKYTSKLQIVSFDLFYSFKEAYGLDDMSIQGGITTLRNKIAKQKEIQELYTFNKCGGLCKGSSGDKVICGCTSSPQFEAECKGESFKKSAFEKAAGPWREWKHKD